MDSLFEALFQYAAENRCGLFSPEDREEQEKCEDMVRHAVEELTAKGYGDLVQRVVDGFMTLSWLSQRSLFRAGLAVGLDLNRL